MPSVSGCAMTSPRRAAGEQAVRPPDQYHDHDRVDDEGAELRDVIFSRHVADAEQERGEERTGDAGGAADRHHDQEVDHEFQGERGVEAENFRPEGAAQSCQAGTNGKGDGEHAFHMNAEAAGDAWIVDRSPQAAAEAGPRQDELQRDRQQPADDDDEQAILSDIEAEQVDLALQHAGQLDVLLLRPHDVIDRRHRHEHQADGEQHLVEMRLGIDVNVEGALEQRPNGGGRHEGDRQGGEKWNAVAVDQDERDVTARHGERAVGEIDEVHQAERDGKPTGQHEQQHAVGDSIEQNSQHEMTAVPTALRAPAPGPDGPDLPQNREAKVSVGYFLAAALIGSLMESKVANSTLYSSPPTFSTLRIYTFCTMSRVSGSIEIGPRGLSHFRPFMALISALPSVEPLVFFNAS